MLDIESLQLSIKQRLCTENHHQKHLNTQEPCLEYYPTHTSLHMMKQRVSRAPVK